MGGPVEVAGDQLRTIQLRTIVERIEHIEEEIKERNDFFGTLTRR